jgi:hypothetical protein
LLLTAGSAGPTLISCARKAAYESAIAAAAVTGAERERLQHLASQAEELKHALAAAEIEEAHVEEVAERAQETRLPAVPRDGSASARRVWSSP